MESYKSMSKKLYRSEKGKVVAGVCSGLAEHFNTDPIFVRLIFILLSLINGLGIIIYTVLWLILPRGIKVEAVEAQSLNVEEEAAFTRENIEEDLEVKAGEERGEVIIIDKRSSFFVYLLLGLLPVLIGTVFLMEKLIIFPAIWVLGRLLWPVILVIAGFVIIVAGAARK